MKIKKLMAASLTAMVLFGCSSGSKDEPEPKEEVKTEEPAEKEEDKEVDVVESFSGPAFKSYVKNLEYGDLLEADLNEIDGKQVAVIKAKIKPSMNNEMTIKQNYFNVEDLIESGKMDQVDELQYWAVADMSDGSEDKVISFTLPKDTMESVKNGNIPGNTIGDYAADLWILPSLQN